MGSKWQLLSKSVFLLQYRLKELLRQEERETDAKRLKEFVEDYDDERDDSLYYRGRELQQRLAERVREADADSMDREKEADELAELKNKIFSGEFENPSLEYEKARREIEKLYEPRILINVNQDSVAGNTAVRGKQAASAAGESGTPSNLSSGGQKQRKNPSSSESYDPNLAGHNEDSISNDDHASMADTASNASGGYAKNNNNEKSLSSRQNSISRQNSESRDSLSHIHTPTQSAMLNDQGSGSGSGSGPGSAHDAHLPSATPPMTMPLISLTLGNNLKKKKIEATGVFVNDDDNDENINPKKRKLVPLGKYLSPLIISSFS